MVELNSRREILVATCWEGEAHVIFAKYLISLLLALAALEATYNFVGLPPIVQLLLAASFCTYALATLLLLKPRGSDGASSKVFHGSVVAL